LVQRFPSNPALSAASSTSHIQKYGIDLALTREIPNPRAGRARYPFCLVCSHPMGTPPHGRRKVPVLASDKTRPVLDYKPLEGIVQESEFAARKNAKQVAIKVPKDPTEVQSGQIGDVRWEHVPQ
jgi:hypothetical protein